MHIPYGIWKRKFLKVNGLGLYLVNISLAQLWITFHVIQLSAIMLKERLLMPITKVYILVQSFFFVCFFMMSLFFLDERNFGAWTKLEVGGKDIRKISD